MLYYRYIYKEAKSEVAQKMAGLLHSDDYLLGSEKGA